MYDDMIVDRVVELLKDARYRLSWFIGADCECDNTHELNQTVCCLCEIDDLLRNFS